MAQSVGKEPRSQRNTAPGSQRDTAPWFHIIVNQSHRNALSPSPRWTNSINCIHFLKPCLPARKNQPLRNPSLRTLTQKSGPEQQSGRQLQKGLSQIYAKKSQPILPVSKQPCSNSPNLSYRKYGCILPKKNCLQAERSLIAP